MSGKVRVGPDVPQHIQQVRETRRKQVSQSLDDSSDDDDDYGPQLPGEEDTEERAQQRLNERQVVDEEPAPLDSGKQDWLAAALGQKPMTEAEKQRRRIDSRLTKEPAARQEGKQQQEPAEDSGPSLLEQHRQKRAQEQGVEETSIKFTRRTQAALNEAQSSSFFK